jgi:phage repressor protein C with HTH and peptisase S24 domain
VNARRGLDGENATRRANLPLPDRLMANAECLSEGRRAARKGDGFFKSFVHGRGGKHSLPNDASYSFLESGTVLANVRGMTILLGKALKSAREQRGLTQADVAKHVGVSRAAVGQWEAGSSEPSTRNLIQTCSFLGLDVSAATGGMVKLDPVNGGTVVSDRRPDYRHVDDEIAGFREPPQASFRTLPRDVPIFGIATGGADADYYTNGEIVDFARRPPGAERLKGMYALYVAGSSMAPRYEEGELIYVSAARPPAPGDYVVVELHPEEGERAGRGYVKRLVRRTSEKVIVEQFNPRKTLEFKARQVKSLHRIVPLAELLGI